MLVADMLRCIQPVSFNNAFLDNLDEASGSQ